MTMHELQWDWRDCCNSPHSLSLEPFKLDKSLIIFILPESHKRANCSNQTVLSPPIYECYYIDELRRLVDEQGNMHRNSFKLPISRLSISLSDIQFYIFDLKRNTVVVHTTPENNSMDIPFSLRIANRNEIIVSVFPLENCWERRKGCYSFAMIEALEYKDLTEALETGCINSIAISEEHRDEDVWEDDDQKFTSKYPRQCTREMENIVMRAVESGNLGVVRWMIEKHPMLPYKNRACDLLYAAIRNNYMDILTYLLKKCQLRCKEIVSYPIYTENIEMFHLLLSTHYPQNSADFIIEFLFDSIHSGKLNMVKHFVQEMGYRTSTAIIEAIKYKQYEVFKFLVDMNIHKNIDKQYLLAAILELKETRMFAYLVQKGGFVFFEEEENEINKNGTAEMKEYLSLNNERKKLIEEHEKKMNDMLMRYIHSV